MLEQAELRHSANSLRSRSRSRELHSTKSSKILKQIQSLKSVDMDTWGLACLINKETEETQSSEQIADGDTDALQEMTEDEADRVEILLSQLL